MLAIAIAAPVTMMLLAASDEMSALIAAAGGGADTTSWTKIAAGAGAVSLLSHSAFAIMFIALLTIAATITLWVELLIRAAAVYVVVLMLPLFFAALVWPARRIWAIRAIELLVALILSKFAIVAVLSLGGAALAHASFPSATWMLEGATLVILAAFSPVGVAEAAAAARAERRPRGHGSPPAAAATGGDPSCGSAQRGRRRSGSTA